MATPARTLRSSLVPIFIARLNILMAIVPGLASYRNHIWTNYGRYWSGPKHWSNKQRDYR